MSHRTSIGVTGAFLLLAAFSAQGEGAQAATAGLTFAPGASLELDGDSSLHRYSAKAQRIEVAVGLDDASAASAPSTPDLEALVRGHAVKTFILVIPVDQLSSGERGLDENMRKALKGAQYKQIRFQMDSYDVRAPSPNSVAFTVTLHGRLSLAGVERRIDVVATCVRTGEGLRLSGSKELLMTDYDIKPPVLMFGAIKTADLITVKFNATLQKGTRQ
ncbi:MAG TPA: YceI family protein [Polyangia bacterium]|nr:YceI family protein [Polyangia bacterium]